MSFFKKLKIGIRNSNKDKKTDKIRHKSSTNNSSFYIFLCDIRKRL